ncbi:MAG: zf-HC2 domain-containing protein [Acidobacteriia bacterium]|nr:zf-HC2 domain-containing protein [Terriglobia bacterium]
MLLQAYRCPPDPAEVAEAYVMETLAGSAAAAFEEHLLTCASCWVAVGKADIFAQAMTAGTRQVCAAKP